jgi:N-acetylglutamate synthase-like GNAT family acetyltransferase
MIRKATLADLPALMPLFQVYHDEADWKGFEFDYDRMQHSAYEFITGDKSTVLVVEKGGKIVGYSFCEAVQPIFTSSYILECRILYVLPEWRGSVGPNLIRYIGKLGKRSGVKAVHLGVTSGITTERTKQLYERLGFKLIGYEHRMEI